MANNPIDLSIVIVNYNGHRFLDECLGSITQFVSCAHEVIIVDNASVDGSADYIATRFPTVRLIKSPVNTGFTGGNNIGVREARGELVLLLNNDTKLLGPIDDALVEFRDAKVGAVGVHLFYGDGRNQASVGYEHTPLRLVLSWIGLASFTLLPKVFRRTECAPDFYLRRHAQVAWVSGAFLMTRCSLWQEIGGLDERYFMYVEDVDYCKQVRIRGFDVAYLPSVEVIHYEGGGKAWVGGGALLRTVRSYRIYLEKHYGSSASFLTGFFLSLVMAARVPLYFLRSRLKKSAVDSEKAIAYTGAAKSALSRNLG